MVTGAVLDSVSGRAVPLAVIRVVERSIQSEQPNRYQETIVARRQSSNVDASQNLVSVGATLNFNRDRVDLRKYSVVSLIADDALNHYHFRMLDTLAVDGRRIFRLAIEPETETSPLFVGMIDVADSTYDVVAIDVGVNRRTSATASA